MSEEEVEALITRVLDRVLKKRLGGKTDAPLDEDPALTNEQAAAYLNVGEWKLNELRMTGGGPEYYRVGRRVLYLRSTLDRYREENTHRHTAEYVDGQ